MSETRTRAILAVFTKYISIKTPPLPFFVTTVFGNSAAAGQCIYLPHESNTRAGRENRSVRTTGFPDPIQGDPSPS